MVEEKAELDPVHVSRFPWSTRLFAGMSWFFVLVGPASFFVLWSPVLPEVAIYGVVPVLLLVMSSMVVSVVIHRRWKSYAVFFSMGLLMVNALVFGNGFENASRNARDFGEKMAEEIVRFESLHARWPDRIDELPGSPEADWPFSHASLKIIPGPQGPLYVVDGISLRYSVIHGVPELKIKRRAWELVWDWEKHGWVRPGHP